MIFYNDFTPFTAAMTVLAFLALAVGLILRRVGAMSPRKRSACEGLLLLALASVVALTLASWPTWSLLLGPLLAGTVPSLLALLLVVELGRTQHAAIAARSRR